MIARSRATLFKALEVRLTFATDIIACFAFLHNLCLQVNDVVEVEEINFDDIHVPHHDAPDGQENTGNGIRDRIAYVDCQEHDYL